MKKKFLPKKRKNVINGLLCLTVRPGESVRINDDIHVVVLDKARGANVRLGFKAPKNMKVYREKIYQRIQKEKAARKKEDKA